MKKVSILGTVYKIIEKPEAEMPEGADGAVDQSVKEIHIAIIPEPGVGELKDSEWYRNKVLRHEIIHAFLFESGLWSNADAVHCWATDEEMTDWIAIQFPKIAKAFEDVGCM